jgi:type I restriction enzyme S subunit
LMNWRRPSLGIVAPSRSAKSDFESDQVVWQLSLDQIESQTGEVTEKRFEKVVDAGTSTLHFDTSNVLYSKLRPYLNKVVIPDEPGIATTELIPLKPNSKVLNPRFLAYYLRSNDFVNQASHHVAGAKMPRVVMDWFWAHEMPLPTPSEQSRIVELLEQGDLLRKLRREADAKAARILPALFLKMFGDPATNPMRWKMCPLRKAIASIDPGWSAQSEPRKKEEDEFGVLKVSAVTSGRFRPSEHKAVTKGLEGRTLVIPRKGDLIFSRANTRELVAATCLVEEDHPNLFLSDKLWRITPDPNEATSLFLKMLLSNEVIRDQIRSKASGSSGSMLNVSQESVLRSEVPLPPVNRQEHFTSLGWNILPIMRSCSIVAARLETLWDEMLHGAFSGQLTANWRAAHMQELLIEMQQQARLLSLPSPESLEASS